MRRTLFLVLSAPRRAKFAALLAIAGLLFWVDRDGGLIPVGTVWAQALPGGGSAGTGSNVSQTRHNLSSTSPARQTSSGSAVPTR